MIKLWTPRRWIERRVADVLDRVATELMHRGHRREQIGDNNGADVCVDSHGGLSCHTAANIDTLYAAGNFVHQWADEVRMGTKS